MEILLVELLNLMQNPENQVLQLKREGIEKVR
jgi:hypothetical protein